MVHIAFAGTKLTARALVEMVYDSAVAEATANSSPNCSGAEQYQSKVVAYIPGHNKVQVRAPAHIFKDTVRGKFAEAPVNLTVFDVTGNIRVQCPVALEVELHQYLGEVEKYYADLVLSDAPSMAMPDGFGTVMQVCRNPAWANSLCPGKGASKGSTLESTPTSSGATGPSAAIPQEAEFQEAIRSIAKTVDAELMAYPTWKAKLGQTLLTDYGLSKSTSSGRSSGSSGSVSVRTSSGPAGKNDAATSFKFGQSVDSEWQMMKD